MERSGIIVADINHLQELAGAQELTPIEYNKMIRRFHLLARKFVSSQRKSASEGNIVYADTRGDSLLLVLGDKDPDVTAILTATMAVRLKQSWNQSALVRELNLLSGVMEGPGADLSIGMNIGDLIFEKDAWGGITPEGLAISHTKRIQQLAERYAPASLMLASLDVREAASRANLGITFSPHRLDLSDEERLLFDPRKGLDRIYLYPVLSYPQTSPA